MAADSRGAEPVSPPGQGSTRKDIVLNRGAMDYVRQVMADRGCRVSEAIAFIIFEHRLLTRIQGAQKFRHDTREDLNALKVNAHLAARSGPGRDRDEALRAVDAAAERANGRLVLVTSL